MKTPAENMVLCKIVLEVYVGRKRVAIKTKCNQIIRKDNN